MNKLSKGVIAAGAATLLLLGGGGTLAYWNAQVDGGAATIEAGTLTVAQQGTPAWTITHNGTTAAFNPATDRIVPGDTLEYTAEYAVTAIGTNLRVQAGLTDGSFGTSPNELATILATGTTYEFSSTDASVDDDGNGVLTFDAPASGTIPLTVNATIVWPFGAAGSPATDNPAKGQSVSLSDFGIALTQIPGN